ncbi:MAG: glycoside hydrolase family 97 catalytic domain-containing protein [Saprospiraceae bacterium]|nr:glycoside hydrolase family 97 catalytic domain-containing protein [Saprospiraceae bacterium]
MKNVITILILLHSIIYNVFAQTFYSPNKDIAVAISSEAGKFYYNIKFQNKIVLEKSALGLVRRDADFSKDLSLVSIDKPKIIKDKYMLKTGKKSQVNYRANRVVVHLKNAANQPLDIIFQLSNDGVAFRYYFPEKSNDVKFITEEKTSFNFQSNAVAWLQPMSHAQTGWEHSNPSYEEHYQKEIPVGTPSPRAGWVFPALFKIVDNVYVAVTEADLDGTYCGARLKVESPEGEYQIGFPEAPEVFTGGELLPNAALPWYSPWRILTIGSLKTVTESTLGTDVAKPAIKLPKTDWIQPGIASWSWILLKDESINYDTTKLYIDYAARMHWKYYLIDADWDRRMGYEKVKELSKYAESKGVKLLLWYNSAGAWNTTPQHPRNMLLTAESRRKEFQRVKDMGIAGLKIDFFAGDGQSMIQYYIDIMKDAGEIGLLLNFHGATLPRGWQRTYPHLMTVEAIHGQEMITFGQGSANEQPRHSATIPFTRNLFDPMDFTPMVLDSIPRIKRVTTQGFELALTVLFTSGIQHLAETPFGMAKQSEDIIHYLQILPVQWDETHFIDGYPGNYVVLARRAGKKWYLCGINAEKTEKTLNLDLAFLKGKQGYSFEDVGHNQVEKKMMNAGSKTMIKLLPNGGFVAVF